MLEKINRTTFQVLKFIKTPLTLKKPLIFFLFNILTLICWFFSSNIFKSREFNNMPWKCTGANGEKGFLWRAKWTSNYSLFVTPLLMIFLFWLRYLYGCISWLALLLPRFYLSVNLSEHGHFLTAICLQYFVYLRVDRPYDHLLQKLFPGSSLFTSSLRNNTIKQTW